MTDKIVLFSGLTSQSPISGMSAHLIPVWFQALRSLPKPKITTVRKHDHRTPFLAFSICVLPLEESRFSLVTAFALTPFLSSTRSKFSSKYIPRPWRQSSLKKYFLRSRDLLLLQFEKISSSTLSDRKVVSSFVFKLTRFFLVQNGKVFPENTTMNNVDVKKYQVWCSSSTKLLDKRLSTCNKVPVTRKQCVLLWKSKEKVEKIDEMEEIWLDFEREKYSKRDVAVTPVCKVKTTV